MMKKNLLIALYNMEIGGIERSLINMLENIDYERVSVDLLIYQHTGELIGLIPEQVNVLPENNKYSLFRKPIIQCIKEGNLLIPLMRVMSKVFAEVKSRYWKLQEGAGYIQMQLSMKYSSFFIPSQPKTYDLAISYAWPHDIIAKNVKAHQKIAWVHTDYSKLEIDHKQDLSVWNQFEYIAAVSEECSKSFLNQYPSLKDKVMVIENLTSPMFIEKMAEEGTNIIPFNKQDFNLLSVGRLSFVKGFDLAVSALKILHGKGLTNIKWYVVGYGGFENDLKKLIFDNNLQDSFILLGKKTNPYQYMKACDLYVQPSRYEGKAVTVTEAMILGKPILITNYPTAKSQVVDGVDGYICDLSVSGLVEGIERLYSDENSRNRLIKNVKEKDYRNSNELEKVYQIIS
jgi:glycosyltransferase involved in cell wall biosynthesis